MIAAKLPLMVLGNTPGAGKSLMVPVFELLVDAMEDRASPGSLPS